MSSHICSHVHRHTHNPGLGLLVFRVPDLGELPVPYPILQKH